MIANFSLLEYSFSSENTCSEQSSVVLGSWGTYRAWICNLHSIGDFRGISQSFSFEQFDTSGKEGKVRNWLALSCAVFQAHGGRLLSLFSFRALAADFSAAPECNPCVFYIPLFLLPLVKPYGLSCGNFQ